MPRSKLFASRLHEVLSGGCTPWTSSCLLRSKRAVETISSGRWYSHRVITSSSSATRAKPFLQTREVVDQAKAFQGLEPAASIFFQVRALSTENDKSLASEFQDMVARVKDVKDVDNTKKLQLYALFKQATEGKCTKKRPGAFDFVAKAKWNAWNELGDISQADAQQRYISLVQSLLGEAMSLKEPQNINSAQEKSSEGISIEKRDGVLSMRLDRPKKMNALTISMYEAITKSLNEAAEDPEVRVATLTGSGSIYCSGNDLSMFASVPAGGLEEMAENGRRILVEFVDAFVCFPKPLVAAVNGPAIGIAVTSLGLCDIVYSSANATFHTPFAALGQSPEACASYTFPKLFGYAKANDMLLGGRKISAVEAQEWGLVSEVFPPEAFRPEVEERIRSLATLPPGSLRDSKRIIRERELPLLREINTKEAELLSRRWLSAECLNAVSNFMNRKN